MKINATFPDDKSFPKLLERFRVAAKARGVPYDDALIAATLLWLGADATTWVTEEEMAGAGSSARTATSIEPSPADTESSGT